MVILSITLCLAFGAYSKENPEISIMIRPVEASVLSGASVSIGVEITNRTERDLLLSRESGHSVLSPVGIFFEARNSMGASAPETVHAGDCVVRPPDLDSLPIAVLKRWILLPSKSSLMFTVKLGPSAFLAKPGQYKVIARYESIGLKEESWTYCVNVTPSELEKLPFNAFEGKLESNWATFTVLQSHAGKKTH